MTDPRIQLLEEAVVKLWQRDEGDYTRCGLCGEGAYGMWLMPETHKHDCLVLSIQAAMPPRRKFVAGCTGCERIGPEGFGPWHDASDTCQSGKHDHCTCDTCF